MKWIVTGTDAAGASRVVEQSDLESLDASVRWTPMFAIEQYPPLLPEGGSAPVLDVPIAAGVARWMAVRMEPGQVTPMHRTPTVDLDAVLGGSVALELGDGVHHLGVGDCAVVNGVDHAWTAGPDGCVMAVMMIGGSR